MVNMANTKIKSKWVQGLLEFFGVTSGGTVFKITESGIEGNITGNVTGDVIGSQSGGEVNPTISCIADGAIAAGDLVYPSGYDATEGLVKMKKADADASDPAKVAWFVAPDAIEDTEEGIVVGMFELTAQNTNSAVGVGDPVYLSTTAGGWSLTAPTGGGHAVQQVGVVTVKNATTGKVLLMPFYSKSISVNTTE
jgi:hypothetical protein